jgi:hypothetical protein
MNTGRSDGQSLWFVQQQVEWQQEQPTDGMYNGARGAVTTRME